MRSVEKSIEKINVILEQKLTQLKTLESEKKDIIARYKKASEDERTAIESEMAQSEQKFKTLNDDMLALAQKVKKLKKKSC